MAAMAGGRLAVRPDVGGGEFLEQPVASGGGNQRQPADIGRGMAGGSDKARVLVVGDGESPDEKFADVDAMDRAFIGVAVGGAHQEIAGRNSGEVWSGSKRHRAFAPDITCVGCHGFGQKASIVQESWALFTALPYWISPAFSRDRIAQCCSLTSARASSRSSSRKAATTRGTGVRRSSAAKADTS